MKKVLPVNELEGLSEIKSCPKCGSTERKTGEFRASGGGLSAFFNFSTERFNYVSCGHCGYTELYNVRLGMGSRIIDFLGGGS